MPLPSDPDTSATRPRALVSMGLACFACAAIAFMAGPYLALMGTMKDVGTFDQVPVTGAADIVHRLGVLGDGASAVLMKHLLFDVPFLLFQGATILLLAFAAVRYAKASRWAHLALALPVVLVTIADLTEDWSIWRLAAGEEPTDALAGLLRTATTFKLALLPGMFLSLLGAGVLAVTAKLRLRFSA